MGPLVVARRIFTGIVLCAVAHVLGSGRHTLFVYISDFPVLWQALLFSFFDDDILNSTVHPHIALGRQQSWQNNRQYTRPRWTKA